MKWLSKYIAACAYKNLSLTDEKRQVIEYGLLAFIQMAVICLCSVIISIFFGYVIEAFVIFWGVGFLRKSTGGAHSSSLWGCTITSVLSIVLMSWICKFYLSQISQQWVNIIILLICGIICFIIIYKKCPVDTENKPIKKADKIKRLRKQSFIKLNVYLIMTLILFIIGWIFNLENQSIFISLGYSVLISLLWQSLTLTPVGVLFTKLTDKFFMFFSLKDKKMHN